MVEVGIHRICFRWLAFDSDFVTNFKVILESPGLGDRDKPEIKVICSTTKGDECCVLVGWHICLRHCKSQHTFELWTRTSKGASTSSCCIVQKCCSVLCLGFGSKLVAGCRLVTILVVPTRACEASRLNALLWTKCLVGHLCARSIDFDKCCEARGEYLCSVPRVVWVFTVMTFQYISVYWEEMGLLIDRVWHVVTEDSTRPSSIGVVK